LLEDRLAMLLKMTICFINRKILPPHFIRHQNDDLFLFVAETAPSWLRDYKKGACPLVKREVNNIYGEVLLENISYEFLTIPKKANEIYFSVFRFVNYF